MLHLYSARKEEFRFCRVQPVAPLLASSNLIQFRLLAEVNAGKVLLVVKRFDSQ
ncbi:Uncharacterised protein [Salmonella enterica subsp. enterica serovar Bovismorbificans]|uniref:Uncharacterized protein n=1 Tax=Salmonella enterica subsp. enterica serovar Bovismorbificans TaxID=58097 RepID=A0A655EMZ6_SALET|nr:Uncharacterised protein [Salmonella enterica subsp. enterica serovar Bovismorbificans]